MKNTSKDAQEFMLLFSSARKVKQAIEKMALISIDKNYDRTAFYVWMPKMKDTPRMILYISRKNGTGNKWSFAPMFHGRIVLELMVDGLNEDEIIQNIIWIAEGKVADAWKRN